jgi:hypothetical protein
MVKVSREFKTRLKMHEQPAYKIAHRAGINPTTLSKLVNGIEPIKLNDERISRVAVVLGLNAAEAFEISREACA